MKVRLVSEEHANLFHIWFLSALSGMRKQETRRAPCQGVMTMYSYWGGGGTNWTNTGIVWQEYWRGHWARSVFQILLCAHNFRDKCIHGFCRMFHVTPRILWRTQEKCLQIPSRGFSEKNDRGSESEVYQTTYWHLFQRWFSNSNLIYWFLSIFSNKILYIKLFSVSLFVQNCGFELIYTDYPMWQN